MEVVFVIVCLITFPICTLGYETCYHYCSKRSHQPLEEVVIHQTLHVVKNTNFKTTRISDCSICLEPIDLDENNYMGLECTHTFHSDCLKDWISSELKGGRSALCPMCRSEIIELENSVFVEAVEFSHV